MGNPARKIFFLEKAAAGLFALAVLAAVRCHFGNLTWGTPSAARTQAVMGGAQELDRWAPRMLELRQNYYKTLENLVDPSKTFKENYDKAYNRHRFEPFSVLPQDAALDQMRGFLLGVMNSDEQNTLIALTQLKNLFKPGFVPGFQTFYYGGTFIFLFGALLKAVSLTGALQLVGDPGFYLFHPVDISRMFLLARVIGPVVLFGSAGFLWLGLRRRFSFSIACVATGFYLFSPGFVYFGHLAKPHLYAASLLAIGLYWCLRILEKPRLRDYLLAGLFFGLTAGALITNVPALGLVVLAEAFRRGRDWRNFWRSRSMWAGLALGGSVYLLTNFHFYLYFKNFMRLIKTWDEFGTGYGHLLWSRMLPYLKEVWTLEIHWFMLPLLAMGITAVWRLKDRAGLFCLTSLLLLLAQDLVATRHWGVNLRTIPFLTIFLAFALEWLWDRRKVWFGKAALVFAALALFLQIAQAHFYLNLFESPMNVERASLWARNYLPKGASLGVANGIFGPMGMPALPFLDYRIVSLPDKKGMEEAAWNRQSLPEYVITVGEPETDFLRRILNSEYRPIAFWPRKARWMGLPFPNIGIDSGDVVVYQRLDLKNINDGAHRP